MFVRVNLKSSVDGVKGDHVDFVQGDGYVVTEEGELDIYNGEVPIGTVNSDVWLYAEKVYEEGEPVEVPVVHPKDAEEVAEYIAEPSQRIRLDDGPLKWVNKEL